MSSERNGSLPAALAAPLRHHHEHHLNPIHDHDHLDPALLDSAAPHADENPNVTRHPRASPDNASSAAATTVPAISTAASRSAPIPTAVKKSARRNLKQLLLLRKPNSFTSLSEPATPYEPRSRRLSSSSSRSVRSDFLQKPSPEGFPLGEPRSPSSRRPPASHSSHGIATSYGPPPAIITRHSGNKELAVIATTPANSYTRVQPTKSAFSSRPASRGDLVYSPSHMSQEERESASGYSGINMGIGGTAESQDASDDGSSKPTHETYTGAESGQLEEDLFVDAAEESPRQDGLVEMSRAERRRSRIFSRPTTRQSLAQESSASSTSHTRADSRNSQRMTPLHQYPTTASTYHRRPSQIANSLSRDSSPISPTDRMERLKQRHQNVQELQSPIAGMRSPELPQFGRRRPSISDSRQPPPARSQAYRPSRLNHTSSHDDDSEPHIETPPELLTNNATSHSRAEGTESVGSATAPSTVWDELDELKSRIKRLELTGKLPPSSGAAVAERPRTATTTVTTVSSSPKQDRKLNNSIESPLGGSAAANIHPLLHSSLASCKIKMKPSLYRCLEIAASDALELASLTGSAGPQGTAYSAASIINGATVGDRQIRRKADNMCRSLTELCILLCDAEPLALASERRGSVASANTVSAVLNGEATSSRQASLEPEGVDLHGSSPSRALSRVQARRTSLLVYSNGNSPREARPEFEDTHSRESSQTQVPNRFTRAGTSLRRNRNIEEGDEEPTLRAPSRARTDVGELRIPSRSHRLSRDYTLSKEYTSQHPMPELPMPAGKQLDFRRASGLGSAEANSSSTSLLCGSSQRAGLDRDRERNSLGPGVTMSGGSSAAELDERRQRVTSMGYYPSTINSGLSGRQRNNSLGRSVRHIDIGAD
ncbi:hypothetical protein K402DRAFT_425770 [Aulographum hederae CBS 113979]|uniref:Uncharacterized protein n=1 Tax=Aulographum hederae CBS 113979 TaxID=1176131 RepID=A0A6G1GJH1_9PEZI|nr:hypothetical protein K402DRAFT_425770 [Aulographum hederae CBS 113979]